MDLNYLLIWVVSFINLLTLLRTGRSSHQRRWAWSSALVLSVLGVSLAVAPDTAGLISGGVGGVLVVLPATACRALSRALLRQDYRKARRLTWVLRWILPFSKWDQQAAFIRALELAQNGQLSEAEAFFEQLKASDKQLARSADLQILRLHHRWDEIVQTLTRDFDPQAGNFDPQAIPLLLRALGETGQPDALVSTYDHFRSIINSLALTHPLRKSCQLFTFAFCGRTNDTVRVLEDSLDFHSAAVKDFWLATADMTAGHGEKARARFQELEPRSDPLNRKGIEQRLAHPLPVAETLLTEESDRVLDQLRQDLEEEARYEIRATRSFRRAHATKILIVLNLLVFVVEEFSGGSEDLATLFRLGALEPDAVRAGEWWRLFMASFLHFGPVHLASNMLGLYVLGPFVELSLGAMRFSALYLLAGLGSMAYCCIDMMLQDPSSGLLVGASGSIMALVGAVGAVLLRGWRSAKSRLARRKLNLILMIVFVQLTFDYFTPHISVEAHLSGLVLGVVLALLMGSGARGQRIDGESRARQETTKSAADPE